MRKISILILVALMAASSAQASAPTSGRGGDDGMMTICYYGVTLKVSQKIAQRYMKLGATPGGCGVPVCIGCISDDSDEGLKPAKKTVEKPTDSEKVIQFDQMNDYAKVFSIPTTGEAKGR